MDDTPVPSNADVIVGVVIDLLETGGSDAVRLREVARRSHLSLRTIYELFGSRDELIVAALERWMAENTYGELAPAGPDETVYDGIMRTLRYVFEPWEHHPLLLEAYHRAITGPVGDRLGAQGIRAVGPVGMALIAGGDPTYRADLGMILSNMIYATLGQFASGALEVTDILPRLERAVFRLTADNETEAALALERRAEALGEQPTATANAKARRRT